MSQAHRDLLWLVSGGSFLESTGCGVRDNSLSGFDRSRNELIRDFKELYGKGPYHAEAFFRHLYQEGTADVVGVPEFLPVPDLARRVGEDFSVEIPDIGANVDDGGTRKFTLCLSDGALTESVLIPMAEWHTLCVSSQVGCARGCSFCETAQMGLIRNLSTAEIVSQWASVKFGMSLIPRNLVFMGMGEPFDNFANVMRAVDIFSDPKGPGVPKRRISISTSGHVDGIRKLTELERRYPDRAYRTLHLAVSLNAPTDRVRSSLMPINKIWPLGVLKSALLDAPQSRIKDALFFEYVLIPGVNDSQDDADKLIQWMDGLEAKVNLIPYHPRSSSPWPAPSDDSLDRFFNIIRSSGRECRTRKSKGKGIQAACGMLGRQCRISPRTADL
jgi:23S rRNA (adenine2503-C2)-methyltransferase